MKHLTLFLSVCWIFWFSQIFAISTICGLSDIPAASVIALGNNVSELVSETLEDNEKHLPTVLPDVDTNNTVPTEDEIFENDFIILSEVKTVETKNVFKANISSDEYKQIINDSGGTVDITKKDKDEEKETITVSSSTEEGTFTLPDIPQPPTQGAAVSDVNLTTEENPIPVFSEWAQKQMEEAEKKLEKQVVNSSSSRKNTTNGNKPTSVKLRAKNYASPDCGAKIIASNSESQNTGALLSSSKDEYMLSPCTSRIWFVIELCEAIQLEKVDLANFELFSSSPKNFSVAVSSRFPTREWSNVGRFIAEDNRNIQSFDLFPHLFGKFVRVDVHSHYNSEHFCPISLFNVYGTSEFEAFETENRQHNDDLDEYDDEFSTEQQQTNQKSENLFKSASDAVMSIVKKAAEVLVKTNSNKTENLKNLNSSFDKFSNCFSPKSNFTCEKCVNQSFVNSVNYLLSCKHSQLLDLLSIEALRRNISKSFMCNRIINRLLVCDFNDENCKKYFHNTFKGKQNFLLNILPLRYQVALCYLSNKIRLKDDSKMTDKDKPFNLTINKKLGNEFPKTGQIHEKKPSSKLQETEHFYTDESNLKPKLIEIEKVKDQIDVDDKDKIEEPTQIPEPPTYSENEANSFEKIEPTENVNIFNLVDKYQPGDIPSQQDALNQNDKKSQEGTDLPLLKTEDEIKAKDTDTESGAWDSIDKLFSEQTSSENNENSNGNNEGAAASELQVAQKVQSESIFIRLSNRIKALERNMSLSGQYLEELSRRYKKQVEELQYSFTKTLSAIEEQNRNTAERENSLVQQYKNLEKNVTELTIRFNSLIACILALIVIQFIVSWIFIRSYRRRYVDILQRCEDNALVTKRPTKKSKSKLIRRKSIEGVVEQKTKTAKVRRPSEEAMRISGSYRDLLILEDDEINDNEKCNETSSEVNGGNHKKLSKQRQRKLSVFYGKIKDNGQQNLPKLNQNSKYERLESVSEDLTNLSIASTINSSLQDGKLIPDEDYENYIPGTDLAYNEFMPEGPSGDASKILNGNTNVSTGASSKSKKSGKIRKLSSPRFLKSPFTKHDTKKLSHGPTSWEWYRSKKSDADKVPASNNSDNNTLPVSTERVELINGVMSSSTNSSFSSSVLQTSSKGSNESMRSSEISSTNNSHLKNDP